MRDDAPRVLIAALSGRALAQAARRDGYAPLVADLFGDEDTVAAASAHARLPGGPAEGLAARPLLGALAGLAGAHAPEGLVCGPGFEHRPALLDRLARRYTLLGNDGATVRGVKDPAALSGLCARLGIPFPEIALDRAAGEGWVSKRIGGAGGSHVRPAPPGRAPGRGRYLQCRVGGHAVSALFLANGGACRILGFSEQWAAPLPRAPFRYGGAARPARIAPALAERLGAAVTLLAGAAGLRGLNAADFLVDGAEFHLLEVNPRPGATLDVFARDGLFRLHVAACRGTLPDAVPDAAGGAAATTVHARRPLCLPAGFAWPDWAADRQPAGIAVPADGPLCTVLAEAEDAVAARALALRRAGMILELAEKAR